MPLLCLTIACIYRERWWWLLALMPLQFIVYPMVAVQSGVVLLLDFLVRDRRRLLEWYWWKKKFRVIR